MSLLDDFARPCVLLEKTRKPDGEGGYTVEWTDGAQFMNYQAPKVSTTGLISRATQPAAARL